MRVPTTSLPEHASTLAESALERKRDLAAERIVPLREVQEAEAAAAEARAALRASARRHRCIRRGTATRTMASVHRRRSC